MSPTPVFVTVKGGSTYEVSLSQAQANAASLFTANSSTSPGDPDIFYVVGGTSTATTESDNTIIVSGDSASLTTLEAKFSGDVLIGNNTQDLFQADGFVSIFGGDGTDTVTNTYTGNKFSHIVLGDGTDSVNVQGNAFVSLGTGDDTASFAGTGFVSVGSGIDVIRFANANGTIVGGTVVETGAGGSDSITTNQGHYTANVQGNATLDGIGYAATITGGGVVNVDARNALMGAIAAGTPRGETIIANSGAVLIAGNTGVQMNAGSGADVLKGVGYDTFAGGLGSSTMQDGVTGHSLFEFNGNGGTDGIKHFHQGSDHIALKGLTAAAAFADATWSAKSHTTTIVDGATTITVYGVHLASSDFVNG